MPNLSQSEFELIKKEHWNVSEYTANIWVSNNYTQTFGCVTCGKIYEAYCFENLDYIQGNHEKITNCPGTLVDEWLFYDNVNSYNDSDTETFNRSFESFRRPTKVYDSVNEIDIESIESDQLEARGKSTNLHKKAISI